MSNNETGLMKKTKKELVEIILRKDDEENRLRGINKDLEEKLKISEEQRKSLTKSVETANHNTEQHQNVIDDLTSEKVAAEESVKYFKKQCNNARSWNWILSIAVVIIAALWVIF